MKLSILGVLLALGALHAQSVTRVSVHTGGAEADGASYTASISGDGRYVAFDSVASNLVDDDAGGWSDVFVHDRANATTTLVTRGLDGAPAHGHSFRPVISRDGRYVAYHSEAHNLVPGDTNSTFDFFRYDRATGATSRVSVDSAGLQGDGSSGGGVALSDDGRFVAFTSMATNLVAGDTNGLGDVFRHDAETGQTVRASVSSAGAQADASSISPAISGDGALVAFTTRATNLVAGDDNGLVDVFLRDLAAGTTERIATTGLIWGIDPSVFLSSDGGRVVFLSAEASLAPGDLDSALDVFVHERALGTFARVSQTSADLETSSSVSAIAIDADARFALLLTGAAMVPGDTNGNQDAYLLDRDVEQDGVPDEAGRRSVVRANASWKCEQTWEPAIGQDVSDGGSAVVFVSASASLVPGDTNTLPDVFVYAPARLSTQGLPVAASPFGFRITGAGAADAGNLAFVGLSGTGTAGFVLSVANELFPLTPDAWTTLAAQSISVLSTVLDGAGLGTTPLFPFPLLAPGTEILAAAVTFDPVAADFVSVTPPIGFTVK